MTWLLLFFASRTLQLCPGPALISSRGRLATALAHIGGLPELVGLLG